jgi:hypothetical protein
MQHHNSIMPSSKTCATATGVNLLKGLLVEINESSIHAFQKKNPSIHPTMKDDYQTRRRTTRQKNQKAIEQKHSRRPVGCRQIAT